MPLTPEEWITFAGIALGGLALGWLLRDWARRRQPISYPLATTSAPTTRAEALRTTAQEVRQKKQTAEAALAERQREVEQHESEVGMMSADLSLRDREVETLRSRLEKREREHTELLRELGEHRARMTEAGADIYRLNQQLARQEEEQGVLLEAVEERSRELETLAQIGAGFQAEMDEMTQAIQLRDGEMARLQSVLKTKQEEVVTAQALLEQRENELAGIIRARERTERQIEAAREQLKLVEAEHDRLLGLLQDAADQTDSRARLLRALREESGLETPSPAAETGEDRLDEGAPPTSLVEIPHDDLTKIRGIGPGYAGMFHAVGVHTYAQLAALTPDDVREILRAAQWHATNVETWIAEARALAAEDNQSSALEAGDDGWLDELLSDSEFDEDDDYPGNPAPSPA